MLGDYIVLFNRSQEELNPTYQKPEFPNSKFQKLSLSQMQLSQRLIDCGHS